MGAENRPSRHEYYLDIARGVSTRGTCLRRNYGAVIVKNDTIVSTGYTGAARGCYNCIDRGVCERERLNIPSGQRYELCRSVHAEANAIINGSKSDMENATLYLFGTDYKTKKPLSVNDPCMMCRRMIINAGIKRVISYNDQSIKIITVEKWVNDDMGYNY
ncbi:MAG: dCMP deaminase family protein [Herbinix sp.]|nr:dCMP deaminase family protein [Herbinix sp.]